ncbi:hypothetical protein L1887_09070 [Cichorium endivia]|nr:hypothetical protein L1887_09070 [Cichorium endivia]
MASPWYTNLDFSILVTSNFGYSDFGLQISPSRFTFSYGKASKGVDSLKSIKRSFSTDEACKTNKEHNPRENRTRIPFDSRFPCFKCSALSRAGTVISETWEDGQAIKDLNAHLRLLLELREAVERQRKLLKKTQPDKGEGIETESGAPEEDIIIQDEIYKIPTGKHQTCICFWDSNRLTSRFFSVILGRCLVSYFFHGCMPITALSTNGTSPVQPSIKSLTSFGPTGHSFLVLEIKIRVYGGRELKGRLASEIRCQSYLTNRENIRL